MPFTQKRGIAIHWVGSPIDLRTFADAQAHVRQIQADHIAGRNSDKQPWADIAYSFLVWEDCAFEGRGWDNRTAANGNTPAAPNAKYGAICVLIGPGSVFSDAAKATVNSLIDLGRINHGFDSEVLAHSALFQTDCPGDDIRAWLEAGRPGGAFGGHQQEDDDMPRPDTRVAACLAPEGGVWTLTYDGGVRATKGAPSFGAYPGMPEDEKLGGPRNFIDIEAAGDKNDDGYTIISNNNAADTYTYDRQYAQRHGL